MQKYIRTDQQFARHQLRLFLGNGDGIVFQDFALDMTVTAHEMFHGIVELIGGGLIYRGMSGALNEHMADALAIMAVQYMLGQEASPEAHWLIGDIAMIGSNAAGKKHALRTFKKEKAFEDHEFLDEDDPQGKTMDEYNRGPQDNYGVHLNSGIPNHALYLAATQIGGMSWKTVGPVWLAALIQARPRATFQEFAELTVEMAEKFFPGDLSIRDAIQSGWEEVRVLGSQAIQVEPVYEIFEWDDPIEFNMDVGIVEEARAAGFDNMDKLELIPDFVRVGVGERDGEVVIIAFVNEKKDQELLDPIEGFDVVILEEWEEFKMQEAA